MSVSLAEPAPLRLGLEVSHEQTSHQEPLTLDLCKGFSRTISVVVINQKPRPEDWVPDWYYRLPFFLAGGIRKDTRKAQVHLARALSQRVLEIRDSTGTLVPIDASANSDLWPGGGWYQNEPASRRDHHLAYPSPSLLKQLRRKLSTDFEYTLQFAATTCRMDLMPRTRDHYTRPGQPEPQIDDADAHLPSWRDGDKYNKTVTVRCAPTSLRFKVAAGIVLPRLQMSFVASSPECKLSGKDGFSVLQTMQSLAERPLKLALIDAETKSNLSTDPCTELAYNGFPHATSLRVRQHAHQLALDDYSAWTDSATPDRAAGAKIVTGDYRRRLLKSRHDAAADGVFWCNSEPDAITGLRHFPLEVTQVVLCPGDRFILRYTFEKEVLDTLLPDGNYTLRLKHHYCQYWKYVDDSEVAAPSGVAIDQPSDLGVLFFDPVSEVALTLKSIFERTRPMPFFRLPYKLRETVYNGLRYGDDATWVRFRTTA